MRNNCQAGEEIVEHDVDGDNHRNRSLDNSQKSPRHLRILVVTQTSVEDHQKMPVWKKKALSEIIIIMDVLSD